MKANGLRVILRAALEDSLYGLLQRQTLPAYPLMQSCRGLSAGFARLQRFPGFQPCRYMTVVVAWSGSGTCKRGRMMCYLQPSQGFGANLECQFLLQQQSEPGS